MKVIRILLTLSIALQLTLLLNLKRRYSSTWLISNTMEYASLIKLKKAMLRFVELMKSGAKLKEVNWVRNQKLSSKFDDANCQSQANEYKRTLIENQPNFFSLLFIFIF